ncbi:hypothetical protein [Faecalibacterium hattorii]|uniref:hypothetical protein n=1 Tax=Faecalibacterium hattorii TaxID=2935520 RepID=UPI0015EBECB6|nr:hypothetical protein [Faecalibacterium hattorii]
MKQTKVSVEVSFTHRNKVLKSALLYKREVIALNWPQRGNTLFIFRVKTPRKPAFCFLCKYRKCCTKVLFEVCAERRAITVVPSSFTS